MRPGRMQMASRIARRVGDPCQNLGCVGRYRALARPEREEYVLNHPHVLLANSHLIVAECDACGTDVIGLQQKEEATLGIAP